MSGPRRSRVGLFLAAALIALLCASMLLLRVQNGIESSFDLSAASAARAIGGWLGVAEPLAPTIQLVAEGRLVDGLAAVLVGAALALSGALLQGLFRNELASPGLIGVSSGASLGAVVAILIAGGEILEIQESDGAGVLRAAAENAPLLITSLAFGGALAVALFVTALASRGGRISVPTLLLVGVAINACLGGALAAIQDVLLREKWEFAQAMFAWLFGKLDERTSEQLWIAAAGLAAALAAVPFVARELDLVAGGEDTASSLGVAVGRTQADRARGGVDRCGVGGGGRGSDRLRRPGRSARRPARSRSAARRAAALRGPGRRGVPARRGDDQHRPARPAPHEPGHRALPRRGALLPRDAAASSA